VSEFTLSDCSIDYSAVLEFNSDCLVVHLHKETVGTRQSIEGVILWRNKVNRRVKDNQLNIKLKERWTVRL